MKLPILQAFYNRPEFRRDGPITSPGQFVLWWERRRIFFNWVVGVTGLLTCLLMVICAFVSEPIVGVAIGLPDGAVLGVFGIIAYGIAANLCYTLGSITESVLHKLTTPQKASLLAIQTFRAGITFSVLLTISPAVICWIVFAYGAMTGQHWTPGD